MKPYLIILGAGPVRNNGLPLGLQKVTLERRVLDWQLDAFSGLSPEVNFVGGYDIAHVIKSFPQLAYHYNSNWQTTGSVASLLLALESIDGLTHDQHDLYIAYSDILIRPELIEAMACVRADHCIVAIDQWRPLSEGKQPENISISGTKHEFIGLIRIPAPLVSRFISAALSLKEDLGKAHLSQLFSRLLDHAPALPLQTISAAGAWAHAEHGRSVAKFVLGSKAATLDRLQNRLSHSHILPLAYFTRAEYHNDRHAVLTEIIGRFANEKCLIVRSSATDEDGFHKANAGRYHSELNVAPAVSALGVAIDKVFASYSGADPLDEVLVQPQLEAVRASGVIFTRTLETAAPYCVINYTEGDDTTAITSGASKESVKLYVARHAPSHGLRHLPPLVERLIVAVEEIEACVCHDALDIEFATDGNGKLFTLQVRPLMVGDAYQDRSSDAEIEDCLAHVGAVLDQLSAPAPGQVGDNTLWSVMADWNPAEIVGLTPAPLALDLYRHIITDEIWAIQRHEVGYRDLRGWPLIRSFGGQAFVDVRASANSFVPAIIPDDLARRIVEYALSRLHDDRSLHDKLEFELMPTCMDFAFGAWEKRYLTSGVADSGQLALLSAGLREVTRNIVARAPDDFLRAKALEARCPSLEQVRAPFSDWLRHALQVCSKEGALIFAHLARAGFVAASLLRSAVDKRLISEQRKALLMESIPGVGRMLTDAALEVKKGRADKQSLIDRFGHLRPGTYDITTPAYRDLPDEYLLPIIAAAQAHSSQPFAWSETERRSLDGELAALDIGLNADGLLEFVRIAVIGREYAKFVFTRILSAALDALRTEGERAGVPSAQIEYMPLALWLDRSIQTWSTGNANRQLIDATEHRHQQYRLANLIVLPPVVANRDEILAFSIPSSEPTFITGRQARARLRIIKPGQVIQQQDVVGCVVAISNADPGFDYLFALGIAGLVTGYGGPNSHMAIRASEFSTPAVIGIGEQNLLRLKDGEMIDIDCQKRIWRQD